MQIIKALFYIFYILNGGFRHFGFEYSFYSKLYLNNYDSDLYSLIILGERTVFVLVILVLIFNKVKWLDLAVFVMLFALDLFFQNFVKFESSIILIHFTPLFFFLTDNVNNNKRNAYVALLFIAVGFSTSALLKIRSGWLNWNDIVIYSYIVEFNRGYNLQSLLGDYLININAPFYFWKICDYIVVLFQSSFVLFFFDVKWYKLLLPLSSLFHILILFLLGITVFFPFMLVYLYIVFLMREDYLLNQKMTNKYTIIISSIGFLFLGVAVYFHMDPHFFYRFSSEKVYLYFDYIWNILLGISVFVFTFYQPMEKSKM